MPRSGSTLVEQILASHPQVHAAGELENLNRVVRAMSDADGRPIPFPQSIATLDADSLRRLGQAYLASLPPLADGKTRITDKMPGNFFSVGLIRLILPNARIIHTVRDPVDTCVSCFSKLFVIGQPFSYDLAELGRYYRWLSRADGPLAIGSAGRRHARRCVRGRGRQPRRTSPAADRLLRPALGRSLPELSRNRRPIATASNVQVRQPLYRSSVARWRRYEA